MNKNKDAIILDAEVLSTLQNCSKKLEYAHVRHLNLRLSPGYFEKGILMHDMLRFYRILRLHRPNWEEDKILGLVLKLANKRYIKMSLPYEDKEVIVQYFLAYTKKYMSDARCITLSIERPFIKKMYEDNDIVILYQGKPDWVVTNYQGVEDEIIPIDTKTSERAKDPFDLSNQFLGYVWALGSQRLIVDKIYFYKQIDYDKSFRRYVKYYEPEKIQEWVINTIEWALEYREIVRSNNFRRNLTSCDKYSGCPYQRVCNAHPMDGESLDTAREFVLSRDYEVRSRPWDVGKYLETELKSE